MSHYSEIYHWMQGLNQNDDKAFPKSAAFILKQPYVKIKQILKSSEFKMDQNKKTMEKVFKFKCAEKLCLDEVIA